LKEILKEGIVDWTLSTKKPPLLNLNRMNHGWTLSTKKPLLLNLNRMNHGLDILHKETTTVAGQAF